jgi:hypothetical protein
VSFLLAGCSLFATKSLKEQRAEFTNSKKIALEVFGPTNAAFSEGKNRIIAIPGTLEKIYDELQQKMIAAGLRPQAIDKIVQELSGT